MTFINYVAREINCKIVYYGPGLGGKTTNLQYLYEITGAENKGKLVSMRFIEPKALVKTGKVEPFTRSNRSALFEVPFSFETRSVISAISSSASTSVLILASSPSFSRSDINSLILSYAIRVEL